MYLSILIISAAQTFANNRGESDGNIQTLQKISVGKGTHTILNGYAIKRALRDNMQAEGANLWRKTLADTDKDNASGYVYGPDNNPTMFQAPVGSPSDYEDTLLFGYMYMGSESAKADDSDPAEAGKKPKKSTKGEDKKSHSNNGKARGQVCVSPAVSTSRWDGDMLFAQGLKADSPSLNPFSCERHFTRYQFTVCINLTGCASNPEAVAHFLNALRSLQVGGNHASNASNVTPDVIAWHFHKTPGAGGLDAGLLHAVDAPIDLTEFRANCENHGIDKDVQVAGRGQTLTVAAAIDSMITGAQVRMLA